jgi:hypothetical protein
LQVNRILKKSMTLLTVLGIVATTSYASENFQPGSADDPIVTKSYVDEQVALIKKQLEEQAKKDLDLTKESIKKELLDEIKATIPTSGGTAGLKVEKLVQGQKIYGLEGAEIIVRSGKVRVIAGEKGDGIPDVTEGTDLKGNEVVPLNHLLLIPRTDNRGVYVEKTGSDGFSYVIIRGSYSVTPPPAN